MARQTSLKTICKRLAQALEDEKQARVSDLLKQLAAASAEERSTVINELYLVPAASLLHFAAESGNIEAARSLVSLGADIEVLNYEEITPVHTALWNDHENVALYLISQGADCTGPGVADKRALECAAQFGSAKLIKALLKAGAELEGGNIWDQGTALHTAACLGHLPALKALIGAGANIEAQQDDKTTPLFLASVFNEPKAAKALIDVGANPNAADNRRRTPLHFAVRQRRYAMTKLLMDAGADPTRADDLGQTPLQIALAFDDGKMCAHLGLDEAQRARRKPRQATKDAIYFTILMMNYSGSEDYHTTSFIGQLHERGHWSAEAYGVLMDALKGLNETFKDHPLPRSIAYPAIEISQFIHFSIACHWHSEDFYQIDGITYEELLEEYPMMSHQFASLIGGSSRLDGEPRASDPPQPGDT